MTMLDPDPTAPDDGTDVRWDLDPLVADAGGMDAMLSAAAVKAEALQAYRGKVAEMGAAGLRELMDAMAAINELINRAVSWASLRHATDTADPAKGADMQRAQEKATALGTTLVFFDLEWAELDDARVEQLLSEEALAPYAHHLRTERAYRDHLLTESEEKLLAEKQVTGRVAWSRLFDDLLSAVTVPLDGTEVPLEGALSRLFHPEREVRKEAQGAITDALKPGLRTRAYIMNTLLADKATDDRLRHFPTWISSRNLANEASDASVQALVEAVQARYDLPQRWYKLKARILGLERLADYDRMASVASTESEYGFSQAKEMVLNTYRAFSPQMGEVATRFFDEGWIDAGVRPHKRNGAFCAFTVPSHHPYVLLNWTSKRNDVLTLAHELGHGIHAYLAKGQTIFSQSTPLTLAETASVFGETLTFGNLLEATTEPNERLSLLAESIEGCIASVFRQVAMNRFEHAIHTARRDEGELSVERFGELWAGTQSEMLGDSVEITDNYWIWWSYVPHFIHSPGYVYAYSYGQLLAMSVYHQSGVQGPDFTQRYLDMLSAGGSLAPEELGRIVGCDLADPGFWDGGLRLVEEHLEQAEAAASEAGRIS